MALTFKQVQTRLNDAGVTLKKDRDGEFSVAVRGRPASETYFTCDLSDALDTGMEMRNIAIDRNIAEGVRTVADFIMGDEA